MGKRSGCVDPYGLSVQRYISSPTKENRICIFISFAHLTVFAVKLNDFSGKRADRVDPRGLFRSEVNYIAKIRSVYLSHLLFI
jgi:hypothetical protein